MQADGCCPACGQRTASLLQLAFVYLDICTPQAVDVAV